ncbi:MAG: GAF domain-containing protein [Tannerella sp.]|jgi:GAF domain-containing protein|nr:GAF domain-containing protein [Tannerella sp.]
MTQLNRNEAYKTLLPQIETLIGKETDLTANLANVTAAIKQTFGFFWVGFYLVKGDELVLGPFQGTVACTRIKYGRGVCGTSWKESRTIIVPDVHLFDGHIACSSLSQSEIVIPVYQGDNVIGVLDIDSDRLADFDETDERWLEEICKLLSNRLMGSDISRN